MPPADIAAKLESLQWHLAEQEAAFLQVVETLRETQRRPFFSEFRARRAAELGSIPGNSQLEKLLYIAGEYHQTWGIWPTPDMQGFGALPSGIDPSAWPLSPPPTAA